LQQGCRRCASGRHQPFFFSVAFKHGHGVAAALVGAFDDNGSGEVVWLGRTVAVQRFGGSCCQKQATRTIPHGGESQSAIYSGGDYATAV
jgi:hypothetical protein